MRMASRCHRVCCSTCASTRLRCVSPTGWGQQEFHYRRRSGGQRKPLRNPHRDAGYVRDTADEPSLRGVRCMHPHWLYCYGTDGLPMPTTNRRMGSTAGFFVKRSLGQLNTSTIATMWTHPGSGEAFRSNGVGTDIKAGGVGRVAGNAKFLRQFCWTLASGSRRQSPLSIRHRCLRLLLSTTIGSKASTTACRYQATQ